MSAEGWIYSVAVLCAVQVLVLWRDTPDLRLAAISRHTGRNIAGRGIDTSGRPGKSRGRQDIADIISELISLVKNGSSLVEACEEAGGSSFAVPQITPSRIFTMLRRVSAILCKGIISALIRLRAECRTGMCRCEMP